MGLPTELLAIPRPRNKTLVGLKGDTFYREFYIKKKVNGVWTAVDISGVEAITFEIASALDPDEGELLVVGEAGFITDGQDGGFYLKADAEDLEDQTVDEDNNYRLGYYRPRFSAPSDDDSSVDEIRTPFYGEFRLLPDLDTESD